MKKINRNSYILLLLALLFAAPGLVAYFFYTHPQWLGAAATNKGELIKSPQRLSNFGNKKKWRLALWSPEGCEKNCVQQLDKLARVRIALGRHFYEVEQWLIMRTNAVPLSNTLQDQLNKQQIHVLRLSPDEVKSLVVLPKNASKLFIANPDNYLVLTYNINAPPNAMYQDIKKLIATTQRKSN